MSSSPASIVCGVDHSPAARTAAEVAIGLSGRLGARLILVYAVPLPRASRELSVAEPASFVTVTSSARRASPCWMRSSASSGRLRAPR